MKITAILFICILFSINVYAQKTTHFSSREKNCVKVETPGLFDDTNLLYIHLDSLSDDEFVFPLPGARLISDYGKRGPSHFHTGVDLKTCAGDTIYSVFAGRVRMSKPFSSYGNIVVIRHATGLETVYAHNSKNLVKCGDLVKAGTPIALTGRTGRATTAHLHFEVRIDGHYFNPNIIFNFKNQTDKRLCFKCELINKIMEVNPVYLANRVPVNIKDEIFPLNPIDFFPLAIKKSSNAS